MSRPVHRRAEPEKRSAIEPVEALLSREEPLDATAKRPAAVSLGALFVLGRGLAGLAWLGAFAVLWPEIAAEAGLAPEEEPLIFAVFAVTGTIASVVLIVLAWAIWRGSNAARVIVMCGLVVSVASAAIGYFANGEEITIRTTLLTLALDILVLLALSSRDARAWARRPRRRKG